MSYLQHLSKFDLENLILNDAETRENIATISPASGVRYENLGDVDKDSVKVDGRKTVYNEITNKWVGKDDKLSELDDVNVDEVTDGEALIYDADSDKWTHGQAGVNKFKNLLDVNGTEFVGNGKIPITSNDGGSVEEYFKAIDFQFKKLFDVDGYSMTENSKKLRIINGIVRGVDDTLDGLLDVECSSPANRDILQYNENTGLWENNGKYLSTDKDVSISDLQNDEALVFDANNDKWQNKKLELEMLKDVNPIRGSENVLRWSEGAEEWVGNELNLFELGDVNPDMGGSGTSDKDILQYDDSIDKWNNKKLNELGMVLNDLEDVNTYTPVPGNIASWDEWTGKLTNKLMTQSLYDIIHPVGEIVFGACPTVPADIRATWVRYNANGYLCCDTSLADNETMKNRLPNILGSWRSTSADDGTNMNWSDGTGINVGAFTTTLSRSQQGISHGGTAYSRADGFIFNARFGSSNGTDTSLGVLAYKNEPEHTNYDISVKGKNVIAWQRVAYTTTSQWAQDSQTHLADLISAGQTEFRIVRLLNLKAIKDSVTIYDLQYHTVGETATITDDMAFKTIVDGVPKYACRFRHEGILGRNATGTPTLTWVVKYDIVDSWAGTSFILANGYNIVVRAEYNY